VLGVNHVQSNVTFGEANDVPCHSCSGRLACSRPKIVPRLCHQFLYSRLCAPPDGQKVKRGPNEYGIGYDGPTCPINAGSGPILELFVSTF
jgi:hypothetical protein